MFLTFLSQQARQLKHLLPCCGAGQVAFFGSLTTVDVLGHELGAAWSTMGALNLMQRFLGARLSYFFIHASRVGSQWSMSGVNLQTL